MQKRALLFDIDGTLVDSNDAHVEAWHRAFAEEGFKFTRSQIHAHVGKGGDNLVPSLLPDIPEELQARLAEAEGEIYKREFMPSVEPFDGVIDTLKTLADRGHTLIFASSGSRDEVDYYIDLLDADGLLTGTTSKDDVRRSKPCPDIFQAALVLSGRPASASLVIGDTPYDIMAARTAGIEAIAVLSGGFSRDELAASRPAAIYADVNRLISDYDGSPLGTGAAVLESPNETTGTY